MKVGFSEELRPAVWYIPTVDEYGNVSYSDGEREEVLVHTLMSANDGDVVIEHRDGHLSAASKWSIRFLDSEQLFRGTCFNETEDDK